MGAFELSFLELAAGLECLEVLLDGPPRPVAVDRERDGLVAVDREARQEEPLDCGLAGWWLALEDMDHVEWQRRRTRRPGVRRALQLDGRRREAQTCHPVASSGMSFALGSSDVRSRRKRNVPLEGRSGRACSSSQPRLVVASKPTILERANHERPVRLGECGKQRVLVRFAVHHMNGLRPASKNCLGVVDAANPSLRFTNALVARPLLLADALLEPKHRLERQQSEWLPRRIRAHREREVAEEALRGGLDQPAEPLPLGLPTELELGRVVGNNHPRLRRSAPRCLAEVRSQDGLGRHLLIAEKPIGGLQLGVIQRLWKALARALRKTRRQQPKAPIQAGIA